MCSLQASGTYTQPSSRIADIFLEPGDLPASLIRILSTVLLRSAWVETNSSVPVTLGSLDGVPQR